MNKPFATMPGWAPKIQVPRFVYHGTSWSHLESILTNGIKPRSISPRHQGSIREECVYFGSARLAHQYSLSRGWTLDDTPGSQQLRAVVKIDLSKLDQNLLYPDENFIAWYIDQFFPSSEIDWPDWVWIHKRQAMCLHRPNSRTHVSMKTKSREYMECHQHMWKVSLDQSESAACRGTIPKDSLLSFGMVDCQISKETDSEEEALRNLKITEMPFDENTLAILREFKSKWKASSWKPVTR
jgi:hypothetical protein